MSFYAVACEADHHSWLVPAGNIGEKCSVGRFYLAHGAPYRRWSRVAGVAAYLHPDFSSMGCPAAVRLVPQRFENGGSGPRCCRLATVSGGPVVAGRAGCGWWYLRANPLRMVRRRFSPGSLPRRLTPFSLETSTPVGEGGHPHRAGSGPICRVKPTADNSLEKWGGGLYNDPFPPCFVSAPPLCRKASLST